MRAEFRIALREEIDAATRAASNSAVQLIDGRKIDQLGDAFQYLFIATSALNLPTDTPGELLMEHREPVEVIVVAIEGLEVTLSTGQDLGQHVPAARLRSDLVFLLKRLIARIEDTGDKPNRLGDRLLDRGPARGHSETIDDPLLNDAQRAALGCAMGRDLTFIWGPPGTGKTQTIGSIGGHLYRRGRSVLLVSHTNTAVDQALIKIAERLDGDFKSGDLVRVGDAADQRLRERDDLLLDGAVRERKRRLHERRVFLQESKQRASLRIAECERDIAIAKLAADGDTELRALHSKRAASLRALAASRSLARELSSSAETIRALEAALAQAEAAERRARDVDRFLGRLDQIDFDLETSRGRISAAESAVTQARYDLEQATRLAPLFAREAALPALADQRAAVEALAGRQAEAEAAAQEANAALRSAEEILSEARQANALQRRWRRLPAPSTQAEVVDAKRAVEAASRARLDGITARLRQQGEVLAELEELDGRLAASRHLATPRDQEAVVRRLEDEYEAALASHAEFERRRQGLSQELTDAAGDVRSYEAMHGAAPSTIIARVRAQLDEFEKRREQLRVAERRAAEVDSAFNLHLETVTRAFSALSLEIKTPGASSEDKLEQIASALAEVKRIAITMDASACSAEIVDQHRAIGAADDELARIDAELKEIMKKVIEDAKIVATTLTRAYLRNEIQERRFDTVILDEASIAPIPALWMATRLADISVVAVGDFRQLPPIRHSEHELASAWLGRDVFEVAGMRTAWESGRPLAHFVQLTEQYRMHPQISAIPNALIYERTLHDTPGAGEGLDGDWYRHDWGHDAPVLLVDTGPTNAWVSSAPGAGRASRVNFLSAVICVDLAERLLDDDAPELPIGSSPRILIATPYRAQARLLGLLIRDAGLHRVVDAGTAHTFQGSEAAVVILDLTVDEPHWRVGLCIPDFDETNQRLLNVALTRAKNRLVIVGDFAYIKKIGKQSFLGGRLIPLIEERYPRISANDVVPIGLAQRAARAHSLVAGGPIQVGNEREMMTQAHVYPRLYADLDSAEQRIVVYSPFITEYRLAEVLPHLSAANDRGVHVYVFTKALDDRGKREVGAYRRIEGQLSRHGVVVVHKPAMHEKLVIIDDEIIWTGSLNVLSFRDTQEWMERRRSKELARDASRVLALEDIMALYEAKQATCPICGSELVPAEGRQGVYWSCLVKGCYTQDLDRPVPRDGLLRCVSHGCEGDVEFYAGGARPVWRCTTNRRHRQRFHPNHLRLPKMRKLIVAAVGERGLNRLQSQAGRAG